ncbi:MAG: PAS domain-containing protein, partial [Candidatus Limnocylindrales bacterium]
MDRVRTLGVGQADLPGFCAATFGVRRVTDGLDFLALSMWQSVEVISGLTGGLPDAGLPNRPTDDVLQGVAIDLYEVSEAPCRGVDALGGGALGLVWASVAPHAESVAHDMIRAVGPELSEAGVAGLHVGRRVIDTGQTELLVVAAWRDRVSLHNFAQGGPAGPLDPAFLRLMTAWRFATYDCLGPGVTEVPSPGPIVLLADAHGRYVDASAGIEGLIGIPAELVLRQTLADLTPPDSRRAVATEWSNFMATGEAHGSFELLRPDGSTITVGFR